MKIYKYYISNREVFEKTCKIISINYYVHSYIVIACIEENHPSHYEVALFNSINHKHFHGLFFKKLTASEKEKMVKRIVGKR